MSLGKKIKGLLQWLLLIFIAILLAISLRVFIFDVFTIPTPSMEPSIVSGDRVVVSKLIPGPRLITNFFSLRKGEKAAYSRLPGWKKVKRNDVLIFNFPYTDWHRLEIDPAVFYAKRCVALPGDTFSIEEGLYKVAGVKDSLGHYPSQQRFYEIPPERLDGSVYHCFPYDEQYAWTSKNFGPLYVPAKGDTMNMTTKNLPLYRNLLVYETGKSATAHKGQVFLGDSLIRQYVFQKNYYFMTGDYVFDSKDSRYWGLLPEDHIVGKVAFVYKSVDPHTGKNRWERFLKVIQ